MNGRRGRLLACMCCCLSFPGFLASQSVTAEGLRDIMLQAGGGLRHGQSAERGIFLLAVVRLERSDAAGLSDARHYAAGLFAEWLGSKVSKAAWSSYVETSDGDALAVKSRFQTETKLESQRMLAGIEPLSLDTFDDASWLTFVLGERTAERAVALAAAARTRGTAKQRKTVIALGMAPLIDGAPGKSEKLATESAKRSALEMVVGVAMAGMRFSRYEEDEDGERSRFIDQVFASTSGFLESYEVLERGAQGDAFLVRIEATVSPEKILDNYRAHLEVIGDPAFVISGGEAEGLPGVARTFFQSKGFRVADARTKADWEIVLRPESTAWKHPAHGRSGQQCHLEITIRNCRTGELLAGVRTDGRASDFLGGGPAGQRQRAAKKAFEDAQPRIQEALTKSIVELARKGRKFEIRLVRSGRRAFSLDEIDAITAPLKSLPGVKSVSARVRNGQLVVAIRSLLPLKDVAILFSDDLARVLVEERLEVIALESEVVELKLTPENQ
jgi:hypothetical protein